MSVYSEDQNEASPIAEANAERSRSDGVRRQNRTITKKQFVTVALLFVSLIAIAVIYSHFTGVHKAALREIEESEDIVIKSIDQVNTRANKMGKEGNIFERVDELRSLLQIPYDYRTKNQNMRVIILQMMLTDSSAGFGMTHEDALAVVDRRLTPTLLTKLRQGQKHLADRLQEEIAHLERLREMSETIGKLRKEIQNPLGFFFRYYIRNRHIRDDLKPLKIKSYDK